MSSSFKSDKEKFSCALAMNAAMHLLQIPLELDHEIMIETLTTLLRGGSPAMSSEEYQAAIQSVQKILEEKSRAEQDEAGSKNREQGDAFRKENGSKTGVKTTGSGLQYEVLREGSGRAPAATSVVRVHYEGRLIDGNIFDSSIRRGEPAEFPLNHVIRGWTEGLQLMKEGAKFRFVIPPELAYGTHGAPPVIGPDATLIFEVELLAVK